LFGIDATSTRNHAALKKAGVKFCCRYLSPTAWKNLTAVEAKALRAHGISIVTVYESTGQTVKKGRAAGIHDAQIAQAQLIALGVRNAPVYFAVDYDLQRSEYKLLEQYLGGAASVLGFKRTGLYAGYGPCNAARQAGWCKWIWQTYAWSDGKWVTGAHLRQYRNAQHLAGNQVDFDMAMFRNYGQWNPPLIAPPIPKPPPTYEVTISNDLDVPTRIFNTRYPGLALVKYNVARNKPHRVEIIRHP
jgi:hypothetical protein